MGNNVLVKRGSKGLEQFGGRINEEWMQRLKDQRGEKTFREMADNDDTVGAVLYAIEMLLRNVEWRVEPFSEDPLHMDQAEFVESLMDDMESTWEDFIAEVLSMLTYGYAPMEIIYKRREGPFQKSKTKLSMHSDGLIGWRDLAIRSQTTIDRWEFEEGEITGLHQMDPFSDSSTGAGSTQGPVFIPIEKLLLFKTTSRKSNPEGRSILRNAFVSYFRKKRIAESEAIGIERDLAGLPLIYLPPEMFDTTDTDAQAKLQEYRNVIENIKRDEQAGLLLPSMYDENNNQILKFELMGTGSKRVLDTDKIIKRYDVAIARVVLADFIMLGHQGTGSYALSDDKTKLFSTALGAWLKSIAAVLNRQGLPRLYALNGWNPSEVSKYVPGDIEKEDVERFSNAIVALTGAGWLTPGSELDENQFREKLDMNSVDADLSDSNNDTDDKDDD